MLKSNEKGMFYGTHSTASAAVFFPWMLRYIYDNLVLGLYCTYMWRCPTTSVLTPFFNQHVKDRKDLKLCDIGVGTGYHVAQAPLEPSTEITLVDLNQNCLDMARERITRAHPRVPCRTVVKDLLSGVGPKGENADTANLSILNEDGPFDVVSIMLTVHCLPRPVIRKARMLAGLGSLVKKEGGVLIGSTVLGSGVRHNLGGRFLMWWHNSWGIFDNVEDDVDAWIGPLKEAFEDVEWKVVETVLLFEARRPRILKR